MSHPYLRFVPPAPFLPGSIALPKKKARQLQDHLPGSKLSQCQLTIAQALGWKDWFTMSQAIEVNRQTPSLPDELVSPTEASSRWTLQFGTLMLNFTLKQQDAQALTALMGLTCNEQTAARRFEDLGPWGGFHHEPQEFAPGILRGVMPSLLECFKLSPERLQQMAPRCPSEWNGWVPVLDEGWRVVLAFPHLFTPEEIEAASISQEAQLS